MSLDSRKIPHQEPIEELVTRSTEDGHSGCPTSYDPDWNCPGYAHQGWMAFDNSTTKERSFVLIYMKWKIWKDDFARSRIRLPHWFCFQPWEECQWFGIRSAEDGNFHQLSYRCWVFQVVTLDWQVSCQLNLEASNQGTGLSNKIQISKRSPSNLLMKFSPSPSDP